MATNQTLSVNAKEIAALVDGITDAVRGASDRDTISSLSLALAAAIAATMKTEDGAVDLATKVTPLVHEMVRDLWKQQHKTVSANEAEGTGTLQ